MGLVYRKCTLKDLEELRRISLTTFEQAFQKDNNPTDFEHYIEEAFSKRKLREELNNPESSFYFTYSKEGLVGYFKLNTNGAQTDLWYGDYIELERIYLLHDYQGKGYGESILHKVKQIALKAQKDHLWLGVWKKNTRAIAFYERNGFSTFGEHAYHIGGDKQMDWLMRYGLNKP